MAVHVLVCLVANAATCACRQSATRASSRWSTLASFKHRSSASFTSCQIGVHGPRATWPHGTASHWQTGVLLACACSGLTVDQQRDALEQFNGALESIKAAYCPRAARRAAPLPAHEMDNLEAMVGGHLYESGTAHDIFLRFDIENRNNLRPWELQHGLASVRACDCVKRLLLLSSHLDLWLRCTAGCGYQ